MQHIRYYSFNRDGLSAAGGHKRSRPSQLLAHEVQRRVLAGLILPHRELKRRRTAATPPPPPSVILFSLGFKFLYMVYKKAFSQLDNLILHQRVHSRERPYACGVCNKGFSRQGTLTKHQRIHSDVRPYTCAVCSKSLKSSAL